MTIGGGFRRLTRILRQIEREGWDIDTVEAANGATICAGSELRLVLTCSRDRDEGAISDCPISLTDELAEFDSCEVGLRRYDDQPPRGVIATLDITVYLPERSEESNDPDTEETATPLHRDRERLQRLYRKHDTFNRMAEVVPEDVSPETIRRYTIEHGIHSTGSTKRRHNGSHRGAQDEDRPSARDLEEVAAEDVVEAVEQARTLYDVQRTLDIDRDRAVSLLRELDLLDLVVGRIDRSEDPDHRRAVIRRRLQESEGAEPAIAAGRNR